MSAFVTSVAHIAAQAASFTPSISTSSTRQCSPLPCTRAAIQPPSSAAGGVVNTTDFDKLGNDWANASPSEKKTPTQVIDHALDTFPGTVAIAFSGAEDVVLIEYASRTNKPYRVFALDTGRLHPQTYRFYAQVEKHYAITIEYTFPETEQVTQLVNEKGLFSFYEDGHQECCRVRKVRPLRRKLATLSAWITGQRKDQSPGTRTDIPIVQVDPAFKGTNDSTLIKYNPLADVSSSQVWATIRASGVPYNALHQQGFISIGCEPCTRAVLPNQHEREGRWWWEQATQKECGLHKGNISLDGAAAELADDFVADMVGAHKVVAFTKKGCKYCKALDDLLLSLNVPYAQYVISEMDNYADVVAALERATGQNTAPNVFIGGKHIGGNEETQKLYKSGALLPLLQQADVNVSVS